MSHATMLDTLDTGGVWSVARGLARNVAEYKALLANCDLPRRNDLDGRGALSEEALAQFTGFFRRVCIDQVDFMEGLVQPDLLRTRILIWVEEEARLGHVLPNPATYWKPCSIAENCRGATRAGWLAPENGRPGASYRPSSKSKF